MNETELLRLREALDNANAVATAAAAHYKVAAAAHYAGRGNYATYEDAAANFSTAVAKLKAARIAYDAARKAAGKQPAQ